MKIRPATDNLFSDLGFSSEESQNLKVRADLMIALTRWIGDHGMSQREAAERLAVSELRISDLVRGEIDRFSVDSLLALLYRTGAEVSWVVRGGSPSSGGPGYQA